MIRVIVLVLALAPSLAIPCGFRATMDKDVLVQWENRYEAVYFPIGLHNNGGHFDGWSFRPPAGPVSFSATVFLSQGAVSPDGFNPANYHLKLMRVEAKDPHYEVGHGFCNLGRFANSMNCQLSVAYEFANGTDTYILGLFSSKTGVVIDARHSNFSARCG